MMKRLIVAIVLVAAATVVAAQEVGVDVVHRAGFAVVLLDHAHRDVVPVALGLVEVATAVTALRTHEVAVGQRVCIAIRPEKMFITVDEPDDEGSTRVPGVIHDLGYLGNRSLYRIRLETGRIVQVSRQNQRRSAKRFVEWDDKVWVSWRPRSCVVIVEES